MQSKDDEGLGPFDRATLDAVASSVCVLDADLRIRFVNAAWVRFARDNGVNTAHHDTFVGTLVLDPVPPSMRSFFRELYETSRRRGIVVDHTYECSSPTVERWFRMRVFPASDERLVVVHSPIRMVGDVSGGEEAYVAATGLVTQCYHCLRFELPAAPHTWDWSDALVERAHASVTHGICSICAAYHYQDRD
jgi:hypothetical protein